MIFTQKFFKSFLLFLSVSILSLFVSSCSEDTLLAEEQLDREEEVANSRSYRSCEAKQVANVDQLKDELQRLTNCTSRLRKACGEGQTEVSGNSSIGFQGSTISIFSSCGDLINPFPMSPKKVSSILDNAYQAFIDRHDIPCPKENIYLTFSLLSTDELCPNSDSVLEYHVLASAKWSCCLDNINNEEG